MKKENFSDLERKYKTRKKLKKFIKDFAEYYANSDYELNRLYFTDLYNITDSCYFKLLEKAVVWNVVDEKVVEAIEQKTSFHARLHSGSAHATKKKYAKLKYQRKLYKKFPFSKKEAINISKKFIQEKGITKEALANDYDVRKRDIDNAIYVACINNWINDSLFNRLKEQSLRSTNDKNAIEFFANLEKDRNQNKI